MERNAVAHSRIRTWKKSKIEMSVCPQLHMSMLALLPEVALLYSLVKIVSR